VFCICLPLGFIAFDIAGPADFLTYEKLPARLAIGENDSWIAIVGDSSVTGAASHADWQATWPSLLGHVRLLFQKGLRRSWPELPAGEGRATRVLYSGKELRELRRQTSLLATHLEGKGSLLIDTEEYGFGFPVGRKLGVRSDRIVVVGQDGVKIKTLARQFERIFETGAPWLPPLVLVSYVANDFCDPRVIARPPEEFGASYLEELRKNLASIATLKPHPHGTRIVILAPLDLANILSNENVLAQKVRFADGEVSCRDLRTARNERARGFASSHLKQILVNECHTLFDPNGNRPLQERFERIAAFQAAQSKALQEAINEFQAHAPEGLKVQYAPSVRRIEFATGDLAADCFHPSRSGHEKIARQLLANELASQ
jgi:hypothetical protein